MCTLVCTFLPNYGIIKLKRSFIRLEHFNMSFVSIHVPRTDK